MFVGHLSLALAAKRRSPAINLAWFVAAVCALDLVWPIFVLTGVEHVHPDAAATAFTPLVFDSYPWSHSLVMACVWGVVLAALARRRTPVAAGALLFALVVSHWVLDVASHAPDMPLWPGASSPKLGLGLWYSVPATLLVEGAMWVAAIWLFLRAPGPWTTGAKIWFWSWVAVTTAIWASGPWGPLPSSAQALGAFAMIGWILVPWAAMADRRPA